MVDIPFALRNAIDTNNCVLFVGAGIGCHYKNAAGEQAPDGSQLCRMLCDKLSVDFKPECRLAKIAELFVIRKGRKELETFLSSKLSNLTPDETFRWITSARWKSIYTTNYDNCIERAYGLCSSPLQNPVSFSITSDLQSFYPIIDVPIFHIHGYFLSEGNNNIIITRSDYATFRTKRKMLFNALKLDMATTTFLYIGYSNTDPNWEMLIAETEEDFYPNRLPQSFRIDPFTDTIEIEILQNKNISTLKSDLTDFVCSYSALKTTASTSESILGAFKKNVPPDLVKAFDKAPVPITRLLSSWEYVNQAALSDVPNLIDFLKGNTPNWSLISSRLFFERDIQSALYDAILEFATTSRQSPIFSIILGAAGYGTSTLLRILALEIVKEGAGGVFFLRPGASILEGDVEYATSLFPNVYFVVDNAADHASGLHKSIHVLREAKKRAFFLSGDHLNEWHQQSSRPHGHEFLIEPLSDGEIDRLLDFLGNSHSLNQLENLPREIQFSTIKEHHHKELLVVMRESTENNNFDAIIESEYRGIGNDISKQAYLYVCSFYQHGALMRDTLLAELLNINITDLYNKVGNSTEGVIVLECYDNARGLYAARARHHKIATVVWERCAGASQKEDIISKTMKGLNVNFGIDAQAFDIFVRSERIVDCIRNLEGRISFFEQAINIDPKSPYVRQHYARMLSRSKQDNLALIQIDSAIKENQSVRVLYHTRGKILSSLAITSESIDIGRKYMIQAESCFLKGIGLNNKDNYGFESLADVYFEWSKKVSTIDEGEAADYLSKAEETISTGLRTVRNRESLWILSSKVHNYLGKTPKSIAVLERAVIERSSCVIARYVLSRLYRQRNQPYEALTVLEPVIKSNPDEFRAFIEYSLALLECNEPYDKAISILKLSTLFGLSDPRFIAVYGGIFFLNGDFTEADDVFSRSIKLAFPADEMYEIHFKPFTNGDSSNPYSLEGEIINVKPGYSLIKPDNYPQIICHASKYKGVVMKKGLRVKFNLAFCAKGSIALFPTLINV